MDRNGGKDVSTKRGVGRPRSSKNKKPPDGDRSVSSASSIPTSPNDNCLVCNTTINEGEVVQCDHCMLWLHTDCIKDSLLPVSKKHNWYCNTCYNQSPLPDFIPSRDVSSAKWGHLTGQEISSALDLVYNTVITWKPNVFKLPSGAVGKEFVEEIGSMINLYIQNTDSQAVAMKAVMVIGPLLLQKPSKNSKNREHVVHLKQRLTKWKSGEYKALLNEGIAIQKRLMQGKFSAVQHEKVFVKLMLEGKVGAALKWISENRAGIHNITPDIVSELEHISIPKDHHLPKKLSTN